MKQSLQLKLHQQLTLTPQLQQSIRLLQLSTLELSQEISQMLQDNPLLERLDGEDRFDGGPGEQGGDIASNTGGEAGSEVGPERQAEEARQDRDDIYEEMAWGDRAVSASGSSGDDDDEHGFQQADTSQTGLHQHLIDQLSLTPLSQRDRQLIELLIDALDDDGYLTAPLEELLTLFPDEMELDPIELSTALKLLQSLDPAGVGGRDLGECLWLQLRNFPVDTPNLAKAKTLVREHLNLLAEREYGKLKRLLDLSEAEFSSMRQLITSLNPRPGAAFSTVDTRYVAPDVFVKKNKGMWTVSLNAEAVPKLRINEMYAGILRGNKEGGSSLSTQLQEARWLIKNVQQRFETILKVSQAIVDRQRMFFEHGDVAMRPLTLKEIADTVELHESTISRVTTQKYMMTPRGLYEFKYFFGSSLATEEGGATSSTAIRALIKQFIESENRSKPLSDNTIAEQLGKQGFVVARRTVAKYRELLNIPPANQRKST
ncbi:MAG: RNA polymerase factor sigma-54 [Hydrogenophilales bacterium 28-61-23]|nr:MAG: RNA polymerase factor sigma-54 [Hydrogenophilales bacterium 28-61-23]